MESERSPRTRHLWEKFLPRKPSFFDHLRFADRVLTLSLGAAVLFLLVETILHAFVLRSTGSLAQRLLPQTPEALTHIFAAVVIAGLGLYSRWRVRRHRREREELYARLATGEARLQAVPHIAVHLSRDGRILEYNRAAEAFFGHKREKVQGEEFAELFIPQVYRETFTERLGAALDGDESVTFETILPGRDGTGRLIAWDFGASIDFAGQISGSALAGRDITEERSASDALQAEARRHREVFRSMTGAVAVYEAISGGKDFVLREFNPAAEEIDHLVRRRAIDRRISEIHPHVKKEGLLDLLQRVWRTEEPGHLLARLSVDEDAPPQWREYYASKLSSGEVVATSYDLTGRQRTEERLRRIAWLLEGQPSEKSAAIAPASYGDLTTADTTGEVARAVGPAVLREITTESIRLLGTSLGIFERDGAYALNRETRGWCRHLDEASRKLCKSDDNREAQASGDWLCHRSCWNGAARQAIATGEPVDVPCTGGRRLYAVPIRAAQEIVGAACIGYGDPPRDEAAIREIAERYDTDPEALTKHAKQYAVRPPAMIATAKQNLQATAQRMGAIVQARRHLDAWRATERRLQDIIGCAAEWVWETDERGVFSYSSESVRDILGHEPAEIVGKTPFELMPPEEGRRASIAFDRAAQRKEPIRDLETTKITKEGQPARLISRAVPLLDEEGRVRGYCGVDRDVTAIRRAEEALGKSDEEYRLVVDNAREGILILQEQTALFANDAFLEISGRGREEMLTRPFANFVAPEDRQRVGRYFADTMLAEQAAPTCEHRLLAKDGAVRWVEMYGVAITWNGQPALLCFLIDITDQKIAEEAARENEQRYQRVSDTLPVAVYAELPGEGMGRLFLAGCAEELTGYADQEFLEDPELFLRILHPDDRERVLQQLTAHRGSAEAFDIHYRIISRKGQVRWVRDTSQPHLDSDGHLLEVNGVLQDVTVWRETEDCLHDRERELGMIREHVPTLVAYIDSDERHHSANDAYCETFGRTRKQVIGSRLADVIGKQTYAALSQQVRQALAGKRGQIDVELETGAEEARWLEVTCEPDRRNKEIRGIFLFAIDATARHRAEESLRDTEARYRLLAEHQIDLVIKLDAEGHFVLASQSCCELLGRSESQLSGMDFLTQVHPQDRGAASEGLAHLRQKPYTSSFEVRLAVGDDPHWFAWTGKAILDQQGEITEIIAVGRDVTEQKNSEVRLQQADAQIRRELEKAHEDKQRLAEELKQGRQRSAETRAELEQQLHESQQQAQETHQRLEAQLQEAQRLERENQQRLEAQLQEAQKLERKTREQLKADLRKAIAQGQGTQQHLEGELHEAQQNAHETAERLQAELREAQQVDRETKQRLQRELAEAQQSERKARQQLDSQLAQATALEREAREQLADQLRRAQEIEQRAQQKKLSEPSAPHEQIDRAAATAQGPATADQAPAEALPAKRAKPEKETAKLQREAPPAARRPAARLQVAARGKGERILIVADRSNDLMLATQTLWKNGYRVMSVGSAEKAVEYCERRQESYDLVVCDIQSPSAGAAERIAELPKRRRKLAVLICASASAQESHWSKIETAAVSFLPKPYGTEELLRRVAEVLGEGAAGGGEQTRAA